MTTTVHLFILLSVLVVVIGFQCEFRAAYGTFETATMEKCEIFQWTNTIDLIDGFVATETGAFVEIGPVDGFERVLEHLGGGDKTEIESEKIILKSNCIII